MTWRRVKSIALYDAGMLVGPTEHAGSHLFHQFEPVRSYIIFGDELRDFLSRVGIQVGDVDDLAVHLKTSEYPDLFGANFVVRAVWARIEGPQMLSIRIDVECVAQHVDDTWADFQSEVLYCGAFSAEWLDVEGAE